MAVRPILHYPDPRLRRKAVAVLKITDATRTLIQDMADTMYQAPGIGLAAIQIDVLQRVVVIDISQERNNLHVFINPEILLHTGEQTIEEGCLSVPDIFEPVTRAEYVRVRAQDVKGETFEMDANGLLATCIQHEVDHLDGKVFIDYISRLKQQRIRKKLGKQRRLAM